MRSETSPGLKTKDHGPASIGYLERKGISCRAWRFDPEWGPPLLQSWNYGLTGAGEFFKEAMHMGAAY